MTAEITETSIDNLEYKIANKATLLPGQMKNVVHKSGNITQVIGTTKGFAIRSDDKIVPDREITTKDAGVLLIGPNRTEVRVLVTKPEDWQPEVI